MTPDSFRFRFLAFVGAALLVLASCSSSDESGDGGRVESDRADNNAAADSTSTTAAPDDGAPVPSAGCGTEAATAATPVTEERHALDVDGTERWFLLTTPTAHDGETPVPLVIDFHGILEGAQIHAGMTQYSPLAEAEGFVAVFPHGSGEPVRWDANPESNPNIDLPFVESMLDSLEQELCIDVSRVYATGLSYGAIMTSFVVCTMGDRFAAVAPIAGISIPEGCEPSRPIPVVSVHGTADPFLSFDGTLGAGLSTLFAEGGAAPATTAAPATPDLDGEGYPKRVREWAARNGCEPEPTDTNVTEKVVHRVFDCPEGADVEFYIVIDGGHAWPSSEFSRSIEAVVGPTTFDIDATALAWEFFQKHSLPS